MNDPGSDLRFHPAEWLEHLEGIQERLPFHPFVLTADSRGDHGMASGAHVSTLRALIEKHDGETAASFFEHWAGATEPWQAFVGMLVLQRLVHARVGLPRLVELDSPFHVRPGEVRVLPGNTVLEGTCVNEGMIIIAGDLLLHGLYEDRAGAQLLVSGDAALSYASTSGWVSVGGELATDIIHAKASSSALTVGGTLVSRIVLDEGHPIEAEMTRFSHRVDLGAGAGEALRELLRPEVVDGGGLRVDALLARLRSGEPVTVEPPSS